MKNGFKWWLFKVFKQQILKTVPVKEQTQIVYQHIDMQKLQIAKDIELDGRRPEDKDAIFRQMRQELIKGIKPYLEIDQFRVPSGPNTYPGSRVERVILTLHVGVERK